MPAFIDRTGQKFTRWTVIDRDFSKGSYPVRWNCVCECGTKRPVLASVLAAGHGQSCGCLHKEIVGRMKTTHGMHKSPIYTTWCGMMARCNPKLAKRFPYHAGRGIKVCERWRSFENFNEDMGVGYTSTNSLDRIDNDGDYEPGNVRWASTKEQLLNRGNTVYMDTPEGRMTLQEAAVRFNLKPSTIRYRLHLGWPEKESCRAVLKSRWDRKRTLHGTS